jgi:menaquinone-specific isochorismate synthase
MTPLTTPRLRATTRPLHSGVDLLAAVTPQDFVFKRNGVGIVAHGRIDTVPVGEVMKALEAIEVNDAVERRGTGPLAVGALPFEAAGTGALRIPRRVVGLDDAGAWVTEIEGADDAPGPARPSAPADVLDQAAWIRAVQQIIGLIGRGDIEKVVLARQVVVRGPGDFDLPAVVRRLAADRPDAWVYADDGLVGVTPELLVARSGSEVLSLPRAGTVPHHRQGELLDTPRLVHEFRVVAESIATALEPLCYDVASDLPSPVRAGSVAHLGTRMTGRLRDRAVTALDLALALHPTPAVGGRPLDQALELIASLEPAPRGRYAGPVGWVGATGDGEFAVALRCAEVDGDRAVLSVGNGIVAGSDPIDEWTETVAKLATMREALG